MWQTPASRFCWPQSCVGQNGPEGSRKWRKQRGQHDFFAAVHYHNNVIRTSSLVTACKFQSVAKSSAQRGNSDLLVGPGREPQEEEHFSHESFQSSRRRSRGSCIAAWQARRSCALLLPEMKQMLRSLPLPP